MRVTVAVSTTFALAALVILVACSGVGHQCDYWDPRDATGRRDFELMLQADIVIVGTVESVAALELGRKACRQQDLLLDLFRMRVAVENVLVGHVPNASMDVLFFGFSMKNQNGYSGPVLFRPVPGERRVLFLSQSRTLRVVGDVYDYTIRVASGKHNIPRDDGRTPWERLGEVLLTLGTEYNPAALCAAIPRYARIMDRLSSRPYTAALLNALTKSENLQIAKEACIELSKSYYGQYGCLYDLMKDYRLTANERRAAEAALASERMASTALRIELARDPLGALRRAPFSDSLSTLKGEFGLLSADPDEKTARIACDILDTVFRMKPETCSSLR